MCYCGRPTVLAQREAQAPTDVPADRGWGDVADFLARDRAARATHEFEMGATAGHDFCQHVIGYGPGGTYGTVTSRIICGQRADHPIHQATPEEPTPADGGSDV